MKPGPAGRPPGSPRRRLRLQLELEFACRRRPGSGKTSSWPRPGDPARQTRGSGAGLTELPGQLTAPAAAAAVAGAAAGRGGELKKP